MDSSQRMEHQLRWCLTMGHNSHPPNSGISCRRAGSSITNFPPRIIRQRMAKQNAMYKRLKMASKRWEQLAQLSEAISTFSCSTIEKFRTLRPAILQQNCSWAETFAHVWILCARRKLMKRSPRSSKQHLCLRSGHSPRGNRYTFFRETPGWTSGFRELFKLDWVICTTMLFTKENI